MERPLVLDSKSRPLILSLALMISFLLLLQHPLTATAHARGPLKHPIIKYHNGPLLTGNISLSVLWYGGKATEAFSTFIQSLKDDSSTTFDPKVSDWWKMVESYQAIANKKPPAPSINVKVVSTVEDRKFSLGHDFEKLNETIPVLVEKATNGKPDGSSVAVIVIGEGVDLPCGGIAHEEPCYEHGVMGSEQQLYIVIKNQLRNCGWACAWPFHKHHLMMFQNGVNLVVDPPTRDSSTHLSIIHFASALASTVTNPYGNGFYAEGISENEPRREVGESCSKAFGTGYFPGYTGRVRVDPYNGGTFNAHGVNDTKFLLPGLWNPKDSFRCWTVI